MFYKQTFAKLSAPGPPGISIRSNRSLKQSDNSTSGTILTFSAHTTLQ